MKPTLTDIINQVVKETNQKREAAGVSEGTEDISEGHKIVMTITFDLVSEGSSIISAGHVRIEHYKHDVKFREDVTLNYKDYETARTAAHNLLFVWKNTAGAVNNVQIIETLPDRME